MRRRIAIQVCLLEPLLRAGVLACLADDAGLQVLAANLPPAHSQVDVVIADYAAALGMARERPRHAGGDGLPPARILIISQQLREHAVRSAMQQGVDGIVLTSSPIRELLAAIHALARREKYLCPDAAQQLCLFSPRQMLTSRQDEVLQLLARGFCDKSIARSLDIGVETVRTHVKAILSKLNASCRTEAASIATARGLVGYETLPYA